MKPTIFKTKRRIRRAAVLACCFSALGLSGCAQLMNFGDLLWTESKHATLNTGHKVMAMLRPKGQRAEPIFTYQDPAYRAPQLRGHSPNNTRPITIEFYNRAPVNKTRPIHVEIFDKALQRPEPRYAVAARTVLPREVQTPRVPFQGSETQTRITPTSNTPMPDMAYVRLSGGTSIADWQNCQSQAGSYIQPQGPSFVVHPKFDSCMRAQGYIPEREALVFMERQALP